jgi:lipopolysaccharide transport system ATP-binding protein
MSKTVISVEHLTKQYDLGVISTGTLTRDLERWWARVRKQPDPYSRIGQRDAFERIGETILALDDVSFTVEKGEALGIIGKNGAGKSTLLKILSRVTAPTSGVVKVKGRIGSLLEVGTGFHPELTGRENVYLNGAILGMKKAEVARKFDEIVAFSGVERFIDTPVKRYSSGMYVRLAFAVAAHLDPDILIVDEVLAVEDADFQKKCLGKMGDVAGEGRTVLFVSHNMSSIQNLCRKAMLLENGRIVDYGITDGVIDGYLKSGIAAVRNTFGRDFGGGSGENSFLVSNVELKDSRDKRMSFIHSNDDFSLEFNFKSDGSINSEKVNFEIRCYEVYKNILVFMHSMNYCGYKYEKSKLPKKGKAILKLQGLPVKPGAYRVELIIKNDEIELYAMNNAFNLEVYSPRDENIHINITFFPIIILAKGNWEILENGQ